MRESSAGYHFLNTYQNCAWKFYIKYCIGLRPTFSAPALSFGSAIHGAVAAFLLGKDHQGEFRRLMHEMRKAYEREEDYVLDANRGLVLLATWVTEVGENLRSDFDVLSAEEELTVPLPNGYVVTARPDAVLAPKSKRDAKHRPGYILETKTTRWGRDLVEETLQNADQITTYIWATRKIHPDWNIEAVIPNVMYQNKSKIGVGLGDLIFRTNQDLVDYEQQAMGLLTEVSQKVLGLLDYSPHHLFSRNTSWCGSYNKPCEYLGICRNARFDPVPTGFVREDWEDLAKVKEVANETPDRGCGAPVRPCSSGGNADDEAAQYPLDFGNSQ